MKSFSIKPLTRLRSEIRLLGDKSIAHRTLIISAVSCGKTLIKNFPANKDCLVTLKALQKLGIRITRNYSVPKRKISLSVAVSGNGLFGLKRHKGNIFVGDSGTTLRLLLGVLAGQDFKTRLTAGKSLLRRPMLRVTRPLRMMGAQIKSRYAKPLDFARGKRNTQYEEYPPITIRGGNLKAITYKMPVASAQVKSAILLAGLYTKGQTRVIERVNTRDHTERMLKLFKAGLKVQGNKVVIKGGRQLCSPGRIYIPGDISSASPFIVLASILPDSEITLRNVSINPTRMGLIRVLRRMGADITIRDSRFTIHDHEPMGDITVKSSSLKGTIVKRKEIPSLIDELPILMVAASFATGKTVFESVGELRVKETDRIKSMSENLKKMGADIAISKRINCEKIIIKGKRALKGKKVKSFGDHRTAMSMLIAGLAATGKTRIDDISCISKSFPDFVSLLRSLRH